MILSIRVRLLNCLVVLAIGPVPLCGAQPCQPAWDPLIGVPGINGNVYDMVVFDDGSGPKLYAGGTFTAAGGVPAANIARWDGQSWEPLGSGVNGVVLAMAAFDDGSGPALFVGGGMSMAGGIPVEHIAKWDGENWSAVLGVDGSVDALMVYDPPAPDDGPYLYAGGDFNTAGGVVVEYVARWDGQSWAPLGEGTNNGVTSFAVLDLGMGPVLFVAGGFTRAGGQLVLFIAQWDGQNWSPLGDGLGGSAHTLAVFDDASPAGPELYVGGFFIEAGGSPANFVARWDGASWSPLGSGTNSAVLALKVFDDGTGSGPGLYAGGWFTTAGGAPANYVARWSGSAWSALGDGLDNWVWSLTATDQFDAFMDETPALYVGGSFIAAGGLTASHVARWTGCSTSLPGDFDGDGDVDLDDYASFLDCVTGPGGGLPLGCDPGDFDFDDDIDLTDFGGFQSVFTGQE